MKKIKLITLLLTMFFCTNTFAQTVEENLKLIIEDAKNDFKKYKGKELDKDIFGMQTKYKYGLTLGGVETFAKISLFPDAPYYEFNAQFNGEEQEKKAQAIKAVLENLKTEFVNKNNFTIKETENKITVVNTDNLKVYDYTVTNNKLTALNIYSSGAEQLVRNKTETKPYKFEEKKLEIYNAYADADTKQTLLAIIADAKNDFKKHIGESKGIRIYGLQTFEYGLTLGGYEDMQKWFDDNDELDQLSFYATFETKEEVDKAVIIKTLFENLTAEMVNKYNYTKTQKGDLITVINTEALNVYNYKVVNNKLTELNIYSSGAGQLARNRKEKEEKKD